MGKTACSLRTWTSAWRLGGSPRDVGPRHFRVVSRQTAREQPQPSEEKKTAASLALFVLLAVMHTWPLATSPGRLSRNDTADTVHKEWILAWDAHQLASDPRHLFDTNTFYPERDTLAYSDHLLLQAVMGAPLLWSGASPVLVYNLLVLAGLALTGWTTSLVVERWTGNRLAGILSGSLMAFNALSLTRFPELQDQHLEFFPLAFWALDRLLTTPRIAYAVHLAGWFVLQALTGGYLFVFTSLSLVAAVLVRPGDWAGSRFRRVPALLLLSAAVAALALTPFLLPYLRVSREQGFTRSVAEVSEFSARLTDYLATARPASFQPLEPSIPQQRRALSRHHRDGSCDYSARERSGLAGSACANGSRLRPGRLRRVIRPGIPVVYRADPRVPDHDRHSRCRPLRPARARSDCHSRGFRMGVARPASRPTSARDRYRAAARRPCRSAARADSIPPVPTGFRQSSTR